jgi:hypothetical protein
MQRTWWGANNPVMPTIEKKQNGDGNKPEQKTKHEQPRSADISISISPTVSTTDIPDDVSISQISAPGQRRRKPSGEYDETTTLDQYVEIIIACGNAIKEKYNVKQINANDVDAKQEIKSRLLNRTDDLNNVSNEEIRRMERYIRGIVDKVKQKFQPAATR